MGTRGLVRRLAGLCTILNILNILNILSNTLNILINNSILYRILSNTSRRSDSTTRRAP